MSVKINLFQFPELLILGAGKLKCRFGKGIRNVSLQCSEKARKIGSPFDWIDLTVR